MSVECSAEDRRLLFELERSVAVDGDLRDGKRFVRVGREERDGGFSRSKRHAFRRRPIRELRQTSGKAIRRDFEMLVRLGAVVVIGERLDNFNRGGMIGIIEIV